VPEAAAAKPQAEISAAAGKGFTIKYGDAFSFNLRSRFQLRYQLDLPPENDAGEREETQLVNINTARLWFSGNVFNPGLTYMIQLAVAGRDYRDGAISPIFDAYIDWKATDTLAIRAGQFFVPFDRLRTVREFALQLAERPVPVGELTLDRDVGVVLYSEKFLGSPFTWRAGVFGGGGTNLTTGKEPGLLAMARLEARPLGPSTMTRRATWSVAPSRGSRSARVSPGTGTPIASAARPGRRSRAARRITCTSPPTPCSSGRVSRCSSSTSTRMPPRMRSCPSMMMAKRLPSGRARPVAL
jgi:hypothetical protein